MATGAGPKPPASSPNTAAPGTHVAEPLIVERRGQRLIWKLSAREANQQLDGRMRLDAPELTLVTRDGREAPIRARTGWFDPLHRNISFEGDVSALFDGWQLTTERMRYVASRDQVRIPGAFRLRDATREIRGRDAVVDRARARADIRGGIRIVDRAPELAPGGRP